MSAEKRWDLLWRGVTFVASVLGIVWFLMIVLALAGGREASLLMLAAVPLLTGLVCAVAPMEPRTRIALLWVAAALLGMMAILTLFAFGLLFLFIVAAYVMAAWMLNEATETPG